MFSHSTICSHGPLFINEMFHCTNTTRKLLEFWNYYRSQSCILLRNQWRKDKKKTLLISTHKQQHSKRVKMYVKLMSFTPWQRTILSWSNKMKYYTLKNYARFLEIMYLLLGNISWEPWLYIWAFTWLTDWRTGSIVYKKGWADYFLRKLRTFNLCSKMLEIYYLSVVASAIYFPAVCYASS